MPRDLGPFDAVVLAGGRGSRAGGVDKPGLVVGPRSLVSSVVSAAVGAGAARVILVGPPRPELRAAAPQPTARLFFVCEEPPGAGPVPALDRGLAEVRTGIVAVLAADLPFLRARHLSPLVERVRDGAAGALAADASGRTQWLLGCWRTAGLRMALATYTGRALGGLLGPLTPAVINYDLAPGEPPPWLDCDTRDDLAYARELAGTGGEGARDEHAGGLD